MSLWGWVALIVYCVVCLVAGGLTYAIICAIEHPEGL